MLNLILLQGKQNFEMAIRISTLLVYAFSPEIRAKLNMMDFTPTVRLYERWRDFANVLGDKWFDLEIIKKGWYDLIGSALKRYCPFLKKKKRFGKWDSLTCLEGVTTVLWEGLWWSPCDKDLKGGPSQLLGRNVDPSCEATKKWILSITSEFGRGPETQIKTQADHHLDLRPVKP